MNHLVGMKPAEVQVAGRTSSSTQSRRKCPQEGELVPVSTVFCENGTFLPGNSKSHSLCSTSPNINVFPSCRLPFPWYFRSFLHMTAISSFSCGESPKTSPCGCQMCCHQKGTVAEMVSLPLLLLCSPFLSLTLHCARRAPLHQPQHRQPPLITRRWHSWSLPSMGTQGKCHFCWALLSLNTPRLK